MGNLGGAGSAVTSGYSNVILGGYTGNQGGLDIRTASNNVVLSDGDGFVVCYWNSTTYGTRYDVTYSDSGNKYFLPTTSKSYESYGGSGILSSLYGDVPTSGMLYVVETGTSKYLTATFTKSGSAGNPTITVLASSGLAVNAVNSGGTVLISGYTTGANVKMRSIIYNVSAGL